jgi:hypothetical protein
MSAAYEEAFNLLCGDLIGEGCSRKVFACTIRPDVVLKVEERTGSFENIIEWAIWQQVVGTEASRWFAECKWISPNGHILVMERTQPVRLNELPERVPAWCNDLKRTNWGIAADDSNSGRWVVCHDYGSLSSKVLELGAHTKRLKKAEWIDA